MLKSLLIRQVFLVVDLLLAVLVAFSAYQVISAYLNPNPGIRADAQDMAPPDATIQVASLDPREAYNPIIENGMFGEAGRTSQDAAPPPEPEPEEPEIKEAKDLLPLRLWGTTAVTGRPESPLATATIENTSSKSRDVYYMGSNVFNQIELQEVHHRKIILYDPQKNEKLVLTKEEDEFAPVQTASASSGGAPVANDNHITVDKRELAREFAENYAEIVQQLKPEIATDDQGRVLGITAQNLEQADIAQKLGLKNGDIIQQVNGRTIDSEEKVLQVINEFKDVDTFRVSIMRNGRPQLKTYSLR